MKQIKLESLVKTERSGSNDYGTFVIYDALADGVKYSWFRNTNLEGVTTPLPEVGGLYIVTIKPNKNPKYQASIKFEDLVESVPQVEPSKPANRVLGGKEQGLQPDMRGLLFKLDKVERMLGQLLAVHNLSEKDIPPPVEEIDVKKDLPF